ncbi:alpha/beta fold hydrolase [Deinococcus sonorensis]|uniref:Alpha/beta fold hydrolase n=2 Tax=Deinococcus sonorensis TaxID=309891 RepID=A0AAU7U545_9DEIO
MTSPERFVFETRTSLSGSAALPVQLGVETLGTLNARRDNAVLVCHYYTGTSHAMGEGGWWAPLIGPGRPLDPDRFLVVCMNSLSNVQARDPQVVTTGPDSLHPDGTPYGARFPAWTLADLFSLQLELMRQLQLPAWHAVVGPSFGGMQALQWAARAPELAPRVAAFVTSPHAGPVLRGVFQPALHDAAQRGDDVTAALRLITFFGLGADGIEAQFPGGLDDHLQERGRTASLRHVLDIGRAVGTHDLSEVAEWPQLFARWRQLGTRLSTVNVQGDQFFPAAEMRRFAAQARAAGVDFTHREVQSLAGHLACLQDPQPFGEALDALLNSPPAAPPLTPEPEERPTWR